jgi:hypothetical protein
MWQGIAKTFATIDFAARDEAYSITYDFANT